VSAGIRATAVVTGVALLAACGGGPSSAPSPSPAEPAWGTPQVLAPDATAALPALAVDGSGNALALWTDFTHVRACHFAPASGWGAPESLDASDGQPKVGFDAAGRAIALWTTGPVRLRGLSAGHYSPGVGWGPIVPLVAQGLSSWPFLGGDLFVGADGTAAVVWRQMADGRHRIWARRFDPASGWAPPELVGEGRSNASAARVSGDESGALIVVWHSSDGAAAEVRTVRFEPGSGWGIVRVLHSTPGPGDQSHPPEIAVSADGGGFVVWPAMNRDEPARLWAAHYSTAGGWEEAQSIAAAGAGQAVLPVVAADGAGGAMAVWAQDAGTNEETWSNRYSPARGWLGAGRLDSSAPSDTFPVATAPRVAVNGRGIGFAAWTRLTQASPAVLSRAYAARFAPDVGWAAGQPIDSDVAAQQVEIAVDATGSAVAVWTRGYYPQSQIRANRYSAAARP
jgi:hypothetical protein